MKRIALFTLVVFTVVGGSAAQVKAADCTANVSACIDADKSKPNAVAKCRAAGQRRTKTAIYVGPLVVYLTK
jgi:hypothetical protein